MRKLVLFGLLAGVFGLALLLEHVCSSGERPVEVAGNKAVLVIGGGEPRAVPESPPAEHRPPMAAPSGGRRLSRAERPVEDVAAPPAVVVDGERTHVVARGETLSSIAQAELGTSSKWRDLARWNAIADPAALRLGSTLRLSPPPAAPTAPVADGSKPKAAEPSKGDDASAQREHKVARGETLSKIAARYLGDATRWREIQRLNRIADPAAVVAGTLLKIPAR